MKRLNTKKVKKGSATILVILIVLTVVLFGVINMMTVYTSYKISQKNLSWSRNYYELDSKAQVFLDNIAKKIDKVPYGTQINTKELLTEIEKNLSEDKQILINDEIVNLPIDKNKNIIKNNNISIKTYFYDTNGEKAFYIDFKIPQKKEKESYKIISLSRVMEDFEYNSEAEFSEGSEVIIVQ